MASSPGSKILYSSIINRDLTLVSHQIDSVDYNPCIQNVKMTIRDHLDLRMMLSDSDFTTTEQKLTVPVKNFQAHVLVDRLITYLCITEQTTYHYLPFTFLFRVRDTFVEQPSLVSRSYRANEDEFDRDFGPVLTKLMDDFNSGRMDKVSEVEVQIQDVIKVMEQNLEKALERTERLEDLINKTEELNSGGQEFRRQARIVSVQARCRNLKVWLIIGALSLIPITVLTLYFTGVIHSPDKFSPP